VFAEQIADGLAVAIDAPGRRMRIVLHPQSLGAVAVQVRVEDQALQVLQVQITAESAATRDLIQESWPQLAQMLEARGVTVGQVAIGLTGGETAMDAFGRRHPPDGRGNDPAWRSSRGQAPLTATTPHADAVLGSMHQVDYRV
jgi:hypothetical protein